MVKWSDGGLRKEFIETLFKKKLTLFHTLIRFYLPLSVCSCYSSTSTPRQLDFNTIDRLTQTCMGQGIVCGVKGEGNILKTKRLRKSLITECWVPRSTQASSSFLFLAARLSAPTQETIEPSLNNLTGLKGNIIKMDQPGHCCNEAGLLISSFVRYSYLSAHSQGWK